MNIAVWLPIVSAIVGFVLGATIMFGCDKALIGHYRKRAYFATECANVLVGSCRKILAQSWFNKVMREYKRAVDEIAARREAK